MAGVHRTSCLALLAPLFLLQVELANANALLVPSQYATIAEAIEAAADGDVIQVSAGVYLENLHVKDKRIAIRGAKGSGVTIIDGSSPTNDCESCILVTSGGAPGATELILDSLVLRNGRGCPVYGIRRGGGIYAEFSSVELNRVVIEDCSVQLDPFGQDTWGGAICCYFGDLTVHNSTLRENYSEVSGGAIWTLDVDVRVSDSVISGNSAVKGGGIFCERGTLDLTESIIGGNNASMGGGVYVEGDATYDVFDMTFDSNVADIGGGLYTKGLSGVVVRSSFERGTAIEGGGIKNDQADSAPLSISSSFFCGSSGGDVVGSWEDPDGTNVFTDTCTPLGDLDGDGSVSGADLTLLLGMWGTNGFPVGADLNFDGIVNGADLTIQLGDWTG